MNYLKNLFLFAFCMCTLAVPAELSGNSAKVLNSAVTGPSQDSSIQVQVINKFPLNDLNEIVRLFYDFYGLKLMFKHNFSVTYVCH